MNVRAARPEDVPALLHLYRDLVGPDPLAGKAEVLAVLAHPGTQILCNEVDGQLRAMLTLHILPNVTQGGRPYALIENVVTRIDQRGHGAGRAVMLAAINAAWEADAYKIMLMSAQDNDARGF